MKKAAGRGDEPKRLTSLVVPRIEAREKIASRIEIGLELIDRDVMAIKTETELGRVRSKYIKWSEYNTELLRRLFDDQSIADEYSRFLGAVIGGHFPLARKIEELREDVQDKIDRLERIVEKLDLIPELGGLSAVAKIDTLPSATGRRVFVVHGHDEEAKEKAARLLEKLELEPVILHEQPNQGRTIIEKFEQYTDVGFAVVLLTPDDVGAERGREDQLRPRARQNVILEMGFFLGKLGRSKVCALHKGDLEIPTDYEGVIYVPMDEAGAWAMRLAIELKASGLDVDLNLLA